MHIEPNPHVDLNNARQEGRDSTKHPYPMIPLPSKMTAISAPMQSTIVEDAMEDRARIKFLIDSGATWQVPFLMDGPYDFSRNSIDKQRRIAE